MKLYKFLFLNCLFLFVISCSNKELTPKEAALQTCNCLKLSKDNSDEGVKAFTDCNSQTKEMMAPYRENPQWMSEWKDELLKIMKDCMTE